MSSEGKPCRCLAKSTAREPDTPRYSLNWVRARRGVAQFHEDRIVHGDRIVKYADVVSAKLQDFPYLFFRRAGKVLILETADGTLAFGLNGWCKCTDHLPFEVELGGVERPKMTMGSIMFRLLLLAALGYWVWRILR